MLSPVQARKGIHVHRLSQHGYRLSSLSVKVRIALVCAGLALAFFAFGGSAQAGKPQSEVLLIAGVES